MKMIRLMQSKDVQQVAIIEKECFSIPWTESALEKEVENEDSLFCVCEIDGKVVGYAGMYYVYPEGDITNVAVIREYRKQGFAKKILSYMFDEARKRGVTQYTLEVRVSNVSAIELYNKLGFESVGVRKNFYDNPKEDAFIMWKY